MHIPSIAVRMFQASNEISGISKSTLPTELIPLNTTQLSRGLLNFAVMQSLSGWVFPFWAQQQYDATNKAYIPRSHLGLSINVTHRNWTAIGTPDCPIEPIVDPRGLVMPFPDGWAIDTWLVIDGRVFYPSQASDVEQRLINDVPVVETRLTCGDVDLTLTSFVDSTTLVHAASLCARTSHQKECSLVFALRPFNAEGVSLVQDIEYDGAHKSFRVNGEHTIQFSQDPDVVQCSTYEGGDCAAMAKDIHTMIGSMSSHCRFGLANAIAAFHVTLRGGSVHTVGASCPLDGQPTTAAVALKPEYAVKRWEELLTRGTQLRTPDEHLNALFRSSLATLLLLTDGTSITPGPFTYHDFWFRDAAYMIWALDKTGHAGRTDPIVRAFPTKQNRAGYFRSQQGEWDSNGEALWTIWMHSRLTHRSDVLSDLFPCMKRGARWIAETRLAGTQSPGVPYHGLMPRGISAEHLGLADHYFWDNFWSLAGLRSFIRTCNVLGAEEELRFAAALERSFTQDIDTAIDHVRRTLSLREIPASPSRGVDSGMIGTVCAVYPLQVLPAADTRMAATLETLEEKYFLHGMFFQQFIHSGMNIYLTLQIAHAWLYAGNRRKFWSLLRTVAERATPTFNFPEAIHPLTGGGSMGDGHHGWASAEVVLALRDAFIYEREEQSDRSVVLLGGIPGEWFGDREEFSIHDVATVDGILNLEISTGGGSTRIDIFYRHEANAQASGWIVQLPFHAAHVESDAGSVRARHTENGETHIAIPAVSQRLTITQ